MSISSALFIFTGSKPRILRRASLPCAPAEPEEPCNGNEGAPAGGTEERNLEQRASADAEVLCETDGILGRGG